MGMGGDAKDITETVTKASFINVSDGNIVVMQKYSFGSCLNLL